MRRGPEAHAREVGQAETPKWEVMALAWFTARAVGTLIGPFAILMAFMAFAPSAFAYPWVVFGSSIAVGLASCYPRRFDPKAIALRVASSL